MRRLTKYFIRGAALLIVLLGGFCFWLSGRYVVPIMMYHNVNYTEAFKPNTVSPENFDRQMAYLKENHYRVISLKDLVQKTNSGERIPRKSVVITFDDGYEDNYTYAYAILKKYGFPAVIFVASQLMNTEGYLTWEQMKEMTGENITIGSHTRYHSYLPDLSGEQQREEIAGSKQQIESNLGKTVEFFAYPSGGFSAEIKQLVKQAGYQGAATTNRGYDRFNKDVYELNRIRFSDRDDRRDYLWIKLSGYYNLFRKAKNPY